MTSPNLNWAGNLTYHSRQTVVPNTLEQIQETVAQARTIKAIGTRHCFNDIADTDDTHLSLARFNNVIDIDEANRTVTVEGGIRYGELGEFLHHRGYALPNLASLPHITIAGATATATHGSGVKNGNLSTSIAALELVTADGSLKRFSRNENPDTFPGTVVNIGALGVVTQLTLDIERHFEVRQDLYTDLPLEALADNFDAIASLAYSVSLFTDWKAERFHQVWLKTRLDQTPDFTPPTSIGDAKPATENLHPLPGHESIHCTDQLGQPGPWHQRLPHFKMEFTPSSGAELQTEYFVPRALAYPALKALFSLRDQIEPLVFVTEIRTIAADDLWLSPCFERDCMAIHFTWKPMWADVEKLLPSIERTLAPFQALPHWGKLYTTPASELRSAYPKFNAFQELVTQLDPTGKFQNPYLHRLLQ